MVKIVKSRLEQTEIRQKANLEEIHTILCTVEAMLNSRPLIDAEIDGEEALTLAHFVVGKSLQIIPPIPSIAEIREDPLLTQYKKITEARSIYTQRLFQDYILELRRHHLAQKTTRAPRKNELVLVKGEIASKKDRFEWSIARIQKIIPGSDGVIRVAKIVMNNRLYTRPIKNLIPLEGVSLSPAPPEDVAPHRHDKNT